jgi:hypothetical protein
MNSGQNLRVLWDDRRELDRRSAVDVLRKHIQHGASTRLDLAIRGARQLTSDMGKEGVLVALLGRLAGRVPAFIEQATQQHRQLCTEMGGILRPDAIAQSVKHGPQGRVGMVAVVSVEPLHHALEPEVGLLDGLVEGIEACGHGASPHIFGETNERRRQSLGCTLVPELRALGAARRLGLA